MTAVELANWRLLRPGGDGAVLAIDFGPRTGQPGFVTLAHAVRADVAIYETLPPKPNGDFDRSAAPERYLAHWIRVLLRSRLDIRAVLAFCAGSGFAGALSAAVADHSPGATRIVLINPSRVTTGGMFTEFEQAASVLGGQLSQAEIGAARAQALAGRHDTLAHTAEALIAAYRSLVELSFQRVGLAGRFADGLVDRFAAYLCYLVAAGRCADDTPPFGATVLASPGHPLPQRFADGCRHIASPFERSLGDEAVAALVTARLWERS